MTNAIGLIAEQVRERVRRDGADLRGDRSLADAYVHAEVERYSELALGGAIPMLDDEASTARPVNHALAVSRRSCGSACSSSEGFRWGRFAASRGGPRQRVSAIPTTVCHTPGVTTTAREAVLGAVQLPAGIAELLDDLERHGWPARARRGTHGVAVWPEEGRRLQVVIDTSYPLNDHRLDEYRRVTGLPLLGAACESLPVRVAEEEI